MFTVIAYRFGWLDCDDIDLGDYADAEVAVSVAHRYWQRRGGKYGVLAISPSQWLYISSSRMETEPEDRRTPSPA